MSYCIYVHVDLADWWGLWLTAEGVELEKKLVNALDRVREYSVSVASLIYIPYVVIRVGGLVFSFSSAYGEGAEGFGE